MPPPIKTAENLYKIAGELRRSQIITTFGAGAIVDMPRLSGIMAGIDSWSRNHLPREKYKIHERNLEKLLGKEYFIQASSPEIDSGSTFGLRAYRFPNWYYCPECHRLDIYSQISKPIYSGASEKNSPLYCNNSEHKDKIKLIPSRFIVACLNGHIEEFPYVWWAHMQNGIICEKPRLELYYKGTTGSLDSIDIRCECGAHNTMLGCMNEDSLKGHSCCGNSPWLGLTDKGWYKDPVPCNAKLRVLQRSANNVYYPVNQSALTIPPWSAKIQSVLASKLGRFEYIFEQDEDERERQLKNEYSKNSAEYGCDEETFIKEAHKRYGENTSDENLNIKSLRCEEYKAFCGEDINEDYFRTETTLVPDDFSRLFSKIKMVKKLREVMVLQGFKRIDPATVKDEDERRRLGLSNSEFAPLSRQPLEWLPAIELFGEGIFIQFNEETVKKWEKLNNMYYVQMGANLIPGWEWGNMFNKKEPRFVLLHTFAHLLIRQLSAQCGYSTASIKERIYSTFNDSSEKMCGILIYTSATDTDGSLGGLVREGESSRINNTIRGLLEEASWCSNDPICIESKNQGFRGLNFASCHACTLLPETSCEHFNCLLDRASITGLPDSDNKDIAFFKDLLIG
jgi:hypothetical protein